MVQTPAQQKKKSNALSKVVELVSKKLFVIVRDCLKNEYAPGVELKYSRGKVKMFSFAATYKLNPYFDVSLLPVDTMEGGVIITNCFESDKKMKDKMENFEGDVYSEDRPDRLWRYRFLKLRIPNDPDDPASHKANIVVRINQKVAGESATCSIVGAVSYEQISRVADIVYKICTEMGNVPRTSTHNSRIAGFIESESTN